MPIIELDPPDEPRELPRLLLLLPLVLIDRM